MTATLYLLTLMLPLATILIVFAMRAYATVQQGKARQANDDAYRRLAENSAAAGSDIATSMVAMKTDLVELRTRMVAIETILKTVE